MVAVIMFIEYTDVPGNGLQKGPRMKLKPDKKYKTNNGQCAT